MRVKQVNTRKAGNTRIAGNTRKAGRQVGIGST